MRDDATRCMGSFRYPVSLGAFGATFLALYIGLWHWKAYRRYAIAGMLLCLWLVWASNSGGSFSAAILDRAHRGRRRRIHVRLVEGQVRSLLADCAHAD